MGSNEHIERLEHAQHLLSQAFEIMEQVADERDDRHAKAYLIDHLRIMIDSHHGFMTDSFNIGQWIENLISDTCEVCDDEGSDCDACGAE